MPRVSSNPRWMLLLGWLAALTFCQELCRTLVSAPGAAVSAQEEPPKEPPAAKAPAPAATETDTAPQRQSYLQFFFKALKWRYTTAFSLISFTFVAFLVMNLLAIRREAVCPRRLAEAFETQLNEKKFQEAFDLAKND